MSEPLGVFGGTFDPVHIGHLRLAEEACEQLGLLGVRWIPAGQPTHRGAPRVSATHRLAMAKLATQGNPRFEIDASEVEQDAPSYTVPTLERLRLQLGDQRSLVLLLGADAFAGLPSWHRWTELLSLAHIALAHRPGFPLASATLPAPLAEVFARAHCDDLSALSASPAGCITRFAMTQLDVSATQIRRRLAEGKSVRYLLPEASFAYIQQHHLYGRI